jgi:hypothetical protein
MRFHLVTSNNGMVNRPYSEKVAEVKEYSIDELL